jgi:hypothetical protein
VAIWQGRLAENGAVVARHLSLKVTNRPMADLLQNRSFVQCARLPRQVSEKPTFVQFSMDGYGQAQLDRPEAARLHGNHHALRAVVPSYENQYRKIAGREVQSGPVRSRWREFTAAATLLWDRHADPGAVE